MSLLTMYIRHDFAKGDKRRDAGRTTPADVVRYDNLSYGKDRKWQILDLYRPKESEGKLPVIVSVHGGGWVYGSKDVYQYYCMSLAQRGFAVVNFSYRLAPKHRYPAQLEDINAVMNWIIANAEEYGLDLNNVFALGDSAGGHLLSVYAAMLNDEDYASHYGLKMADIRFNAIALNCGVYHLDAANKKDMTVRLLNAVLPRGWNETDLSFFNSADKVKAGYPPVFLMTANGDFLKDQVNYLIPSLEENAIPYELHIYGTDDNVLSHVFHVNISLKDAAICNDEECQFFRKYLKECA